MPIESYAPTDPRSQLADWIEMSAVASPLHYVTRSQFVRASSALDEPPEPNDEDLGDDQDDETFGVGGRQVLDERQDNLATRAFEELAWRASVLNDLYPFELEVDGANWTVRLRRPHALASHFAYLFCLLVSCIKYKYVRLSHLDARYRAIAEHFQLLSYIVAPQLIGGDAYWMGWPRPDKTSSFRSGLETLLKNVEVGKLHADNPDWDSGMAKDGTVDLVMWRGFRDKRPGKAIVYGQVASGRNWRLKPLKTYIDPYFLEWFAAKPSKYKFYSMFIPFPQHESCKPSKGQVFEAIAREQGRRDERTFGIVVDRVRIVELLEGLVTLTGQFPEPEATTILEKLMSLARWTAGARKLAS